ncbi:hypothetical protein PQ478_08680 [Alkalihalophilus pseudofirmus]|uniref:hypothetical protein n=1 Tax=Alkalihalophilus pseudofirmus TaxID=79885 RepID=UPI00259B7C55|nr:hypothetical protein [Alkalihalophilus pseudofirmus]WEG18544.1 hypothetical protein PQ478_08680 [Alkalihalophilus pseudofirmus]
MDKNSKNYNDLLRWIVKDIKDLPRRDRKTLNERYLHGSIGTLDMFGVVTTQEEFKSFKKDVEELTGMVFN